MKFKFLIASSLILFIITLGVASASENITDNITQSNDCEVLEDAVPGGTFGDIQNAVNNAEENDVIELNGTYVGYASEIKINKNLELRGGSNGATLDARQMSGIIKTSSSKYTITLRNINFINANNGAFRDADSSSSKGTLIIDNCNFTNNAGDEYGAIVCSYCKVTNSNFINNKATGIFDGDDDVSWGGAISAGSCDLVNCYFERNTALTSGGALYCGQANADKCSFKQNSAPSGGAIDAQLNIKNSNFTSNSATKFSGGALQGAGTIEKSTFTKNTAKLRGGAIDGDVKVANSKFTENKALYGGAIHCTYCDEGYIEIKNSTFKSNSEGAVIADGIILKSPNKSYDGKTVLNNDLTSIKLIKVSVKKLTTTYKSGKNLEIKLTTTVSNKPASSLGIYCYAYKGGKSFNTWTYTDEYVYSNSKGVAVFEASKLPVGTYTIKIMEGYLDDDGEYFVCPVPTTKVTVKITKAKTTVKAPKVTAKYKKTKYFKITVKDKNTKKVMKSLKLKVKVYTGKKYKSFTVKTDKKGVAKLNTKTFKKGSHKVVISSKNSNISLSKKSKIIIK